MKNLKHYIQEKLFHQQVDEKLIVNKNYTIASKVDDIWDIMDDESSLSWAGKRYSADKKLNIDDILFYMIHTYGRFKYIVNDTVDLYNSIIKKYKERKLSTEFDKKEFEGALILNNFAGMRNSHVSKIIGIIRNTEFNDEILITTKHNSNTGNNDIYVLDIYEDESYLILAINLRDGNRMSLKTMDCMFILKKI